MHIPPAGLLRWHALRAARRQSQPPLRCAACRRGQEGRGPHPHLRVRRLVGSAVKAPGGHVNWQILVVWVVGDLQRRRGRAGTGVVGIAAGGQLAACVAVAASPVLPLPLRVRAATLPRAAPSCSPTG